MSMLHHNYAVHNLYLYFQMEIVAATAHTTHKILLQSEKKE